MIEVVIWPMRHPQPLHHAARAPIHLGRERHDFGQCEGDDGEVERQARAFGGVTVAPERLVQPPPDLDTRCEVRLEGGNREPDKTGTPATELQPPPAPTPPL